MSENTNIGHYSIPTFLNSTTKIVVSTAILYFLIAKLSLFIFVTEINILPFFPAIGFAIAASLIFGRKAILGVGIGCLLFSINLYKSDFENATTFQELVKPLLLCIIRPIIAGLNTFLVSYLSQLWCKNKYPFDSEKNVILFTFAGLLGTFISISLGFIPLVMTSFFSLDDVILIWSNICRGNFMGIILFTPFLLSWIQDTKEFTRWSTTKKAEVVVLIIFTVFTTLYVFESRANNQSILLFLLIWASCRFGMKIITLVSLIISILAIYCTGHHMGGFIFSGWNNDFLMLQLFLLVNMVSALFLKAILKEKESEQNKLRISEQSFNLKNSILQATIENPNGISIFSLDTDLNYINFNSVHARYMKNVQGVEIKIGDNHPELFSNLVQKEEITTRLHEVLKGRTYSFEEKHSEEEYLNISKSPIKDDKSKIIGITTIITDITELKLKELQLEKNNYTLNERIKELRCLFDISKIISNKTLSKSEKMEACVQAIPKALQFPEIANCRIQFRDKEFISDNYQENDFKLNQKIIINGEDCGWIEAGYFDTKKHTNENIFLDEEIKLMETLADIISKSIETKIAEENLKISEEKFRAIYESFDDIYFKKTLDGTLLDVSPSIEKHFNMKRELVIGQNAYDFYFDRDEGERFYEAILLNQQVNDYEERFVTGSGEIIYFSVNAKVIYDSNGEPAYFEGTMRNVNERILNQKRLLEVTEKIKESEEKFRSIFENMQDVYYLHDIEGELINISPSIEKHFRIKREDVIGLNAKDFYYESDKYDELKTKLLKEGTINDQEVQFLTATGETLYFSVNSKLINDSNGNPTLVEGTMRNINERIKNQKQLLEASQKIKESEEKFRSIYENMEDVYFLHELDGTMIDISPSAEKVFQIKKEEFIGVKAQIFHISPARHEELQEKLQKNGSIHDEEVEFLTATGETIYFSASAKLIYDPNRNRTLVEGTMRNINERINNQNKLLEATEKIKQSEEEFRAIFESFEDVYFRTTLDGYFQNVSPSVEKILKYKREDLIGKHSIDLYLYPEDRVRAVEIIKEKGHINDFETIFKDKNNNPVHLSVNGHFVYDSKGDVLYLEGTIRDISERKKNELKIEIANQEIKESEKKYRTIFESVRDVFFRASAKDHKIIDISPSCSYFDMEPNQIIGKSIIEFYQNPEDRIPVLNELMRNGEIKNYDAKFLLNSKKFTVSINSKIVYDQNNEPEFLIGSFRDVSDRVQAEENLKISEAKFRSIFENFEDIYFRTTMDGKILDVSPSFEKHFLKPCSLALDNSVFDFYYDEKDRVSLLKKLKEDGQVKDCDIRFRDGNDNIVFFSVNARLIYDENGEPVYIEKSMRNINDRVAFQKEMLTKNRQLEFQNTELEQFAYIASHDLQEPLITIIQFIKLLQEELGQNLDDDQKQYLHFINSSTSRMQLLVKGLLDYSRIGKERRTSSINCNEIVANVIEDMDASLKENNTIIEYENLPIIEGNTTEMRQLFQNMISNANKFRKKDKQPKIKIAAVKEENNWLFSIEDNGIGIEEQDIDKVFVIFKRLNNRSDYNGTGIGLSHCKKIIEHHRGKIWVESKFNEGSTFKWTFPLEQN